MNREEAIHILEYERDNEGQDLPDMKLLEELCPILQFRTA